MCLSMLTWRFTVSLRRHDRVVREVEHGRAAEAAVREQHRPPLRRRRRRLPPLRGRPCLQRNVRQRQACGVASMLLLEIVASKPARTVLPCCHHHLQHCGQP